MSTGWYASNVEIILFSATRRQTLWKYITRKYEVKEHTWNGDSDHVKSNNGHNNNKGRRRRQALATDMIYTAQQRFVCVCLVHVKNGYVMTRINVIPFRWTLRGTSIIYGTPNYKAAQRILTNKANICITKTQKVLWPTIDSNTMYSQHIRIKMCWFPDWFELPQLN